MSPEQASGEREIDARSDVYSLACVVYEMLAGQPPYTGATAEAVLARKAVEAVPSVRVVRRAVPEAVETAVRTALSVVPADRHPTAAAFIEALDGGPLRPARAAPRVRRPVRLAALAATIVMVLALGWWGVGQREASPRVETLAVLPFANLSGDPEQQYFADGMTEELIARLSDIGGLTVRSRTSVMRYRNTGEPLPQIAGVLGVDALIEGSVARAEGRVRIRAQLVRARPERTLWSRTYDRDLRDAMALQSEVARAIAVEIGAAVTAAEEGRMARASAVDPVASEAYFKGRFYWNRRTGEDLQRAIRHYEQAIAIDSGFARAYAGLAESYVVLSHSRLAVLPAGEALPRARAAAERALELDEDLAAAHAALAYVATYQYRWDAAERWFQRALALDPGYGTTHFWYAAALAAQGRTEEAIVRSRQGEQVEPLSPVIAAGVAWMLHLARRHEEAVAQAKRVLELEPGFAIGHYRLGVAYSWLGRYDDAIRELERGYEASGRNPSFLASLAKVEALAGRAAEARRKLAELTTVARERYVPAYSIAAVHAALGDADQAFVWLERAFEEGSNDIAFLAVEPEMDSLRSDPRFQNLLRRMGLAS